MPLADFAERYPALIQRLCQARAAGRVGHAYLLCGDNAETLDRLAAAWLQACACPSPTAAGDACGRCPACLALAAGRYPYLQRIVPRSKLRQITVDQMRELERVLFLKSAGELKAAVIRDADRMNVEAQNAFLKTLEEPANHTLLLLLSTLPGALLPTIVSRCQQIALFENRVDYAAVLGEEYLGILHGLRPGAGAETALRLATRFTALLEACRSAAEAEADEHLAQQRAALSPELTPAEKSAWNKRFDEEASAIVAASYLSHREQLLSALQCYWSQEYLRANGVPREQLPYPEFYQGAPAAVLAQALPQRLARQALEHSERLAATLQFNVGEELAVGEFCQALCSKS